MKKKNYIFPETIILEVNLQPLMDASQMDVYSDDTDGIDDEANVLSRKGFSVWGEDEE